MICRTRNALHPRRDDAEMIEMRGAQLNFGDGSIAHHGQDHKDRGRDRK
jgi:hypothetical protein